MGTEAIGLNFNMCKYEITHYSRNYHIIEFMLENSSWVDWSKANQTATISGRVHYL